MDEKLETALQGAQALGRAMETCGLSAQQAARAGGAAFGGLRTEQERYNASLQTGAAYLDAFEQKLRAYANALYAGDLLESVFGAALEGPQQALEQLRASLRELRELKLDGLMEGFGAQAKEARALLDELVSTADAAAQKTAAAFGAGAQAQETASARLESVYGRLQGLQETLARQPVADPALDNVRQQAAASAGGAAQSALALPQGARQTPGFAEGLEHAYSIVSKISSLLQLIGSFAGKGGGVANVLTKVLGVTNAVGWTINAASLAWEAYEYAAGGANDRMEKSRQKLAELNEAFSVQQQQLAHIDAEAQLVDTLAASLRELQARYAGTEDLEARKTLREEMMAAERELAAVVGETTQENLKNSGYSIEAVAQQKEAYETSKDAIAETQAQLRGEIFNTSLEVAKQCDEQIMAINNEAEGFDAAADAIGEALGKIKEYQYRYYDWRLHSVKEDKVAFEDSYKRRDVDDMLRSEGLRGGDEETVQALEDMDGWIDVHGKATIENFDQEILRIKAEMNKIKGTALVTVQNEKMKYLKTADNVRNLLNRTGGNSSPTYPYGALSARAPQSVSPSYAASRLPENPYKAAQDKQFAAAKKAADEYADSLRNLAALEERYGEAIVGPLYKSGLMAQRLQALQQESEVYQKSVDGELQIEDHWLQAMGLKREAWQALSIEKKAEAMAAQEEAFGGSTAFAAALQTLEAYQQKIKETEQARAAIQEEQRRADFGGLHDETEARQRRGRQIDNREQMKRNELEGYMGVDRQERQRQIHYEAAKGRLEIALEKQTETEHAYLDALRDLPTVLDRAEKSVEAKRKALQGLDKESEAYQRGALELAGAEKELELAQGGMTRKIVETQAALEDAELETSEAEKSVQKYGDKWQDVRNKVGNILSQMIFEGKSFKDIMKNLWLEFSQDALRRILRVPGATENTSFIGSFLGLLLKHEGGKITRDLPKMHGGGRVLEKPSLADDEVVRVLQVGERVLSKGDNARFENLMPRVASLAGRGQAMAPALGADVMAQTRAVMADAKQTKAQIAHMQRTNELLTDIVQNMAADSGAQGNVVVLNSTDMAQVIQMVPQGLGQAVMQYMHRQGMLGKGNFRA